MASVGVFGFIALVLAAVAAWFGVVVGTPNRETAVVPATSRRL